MVSRRNKPVRTWHRASACVLGMYTYSSHSIQIQRCKEIHILWRLYIGVNHLQLPPRAWQFYIQNLTTTTISYPPQSTLLSGWIPRTELYLINVDFYLINTNHFLWNIYIYFHCKKNSVLARSKSFKPSHTESSFPLSGLGVSVQFSIWP